MYLVPGEVVDLVLGGGDLLPAGGRQPEALLVHPGEVVLVVLLVLHVGDPINCRQVVLNMSRMLFP